MKYFFTLLFAVALFGSCRKENLNSIPNESISATRNLKVEKFAKEKLSPAEFERYDFAKVHVIAKKDTVRGWQVIAKSQLPGQIEFLIINAKDGAPVGISINLLKFDGRSYNNKLIGVTNTNKLTGKTRNYDLSPANSTKELSGIRQVKRLSTPWSTLPEVVIIGSRTVPGLNLTPGTYAISSRLFNLLQANGGSGGAETEGNGDLAFDNTTNLDYILPAGVGTGGAPYMFSLDQIPVFSTYTFDNQNYLWTPEDDYPGKANGFPFDWWNNLGFTPHEQEIYFQLLNERETVVDEINTPCHGTNHLPGGMRKPGTNLPFPGTAEHAIIQLDYMIRYPGSTREYAIPGAGRADIVNIPLREIFEIKPETQISSGLVEISNYVQMATLNCGIGTWRPGVLYTPTILPHPTDPNSNLSATLDNPGLIVYRKVPKTTTPQPFVIPPSLTVTQSLKKLLKDVLTNTEIGLTEAYLIYFLKMQEHEELRDWIKTHGPAIAASIILGTIAADFVSGGVSIWDDAATINLGLLIARVGAKL